VEEGMRLPTGYVLTAQDIRYLRKVEKVSKDMIGLVGDRGLTGVEEVRGDRVYVRDARSVGDYDISRSVDRGKLQTVYEEIRDALIQTSEVSAELRLDEVKKRLEEVKSGKLLDTDFMSIWDGESGKVMIHHLLDRTLNKKDIPKVNEDLDKLYVQWANENSGSALTRDLDFQTLADELRQLSPTPVPGLELQLQKDLVDVALRVLGEHGSESGDTTGQAVTKDDRTSTRDFLSTPANTLRVPSYLFRYGAATEADQLTYLAAPRRAMLARFVRDMQRFHNSLKRIGSGKDTQNSDIPAPLRRSTLEASKKAIKDYVDSSDTLLSALRSNLDNPQGQGVVSRNEDRLVPTLEFNWTDVGYSLLLNKPLTLAFNLPSSTFGLLLHESQMFGSMKGLLRLVKNVAGLASKAAVGLTEGATYTAAGGADYLFRRFGKADPQSSAVIEEAMGKGAFTQMLDDVYEKLERNRIVKALGLDYQNMSRMINDRGYSYREPLRSTWRRIGAAVTLGGGFRMKHIPVRIAKTAGALIDKAGLSFVDKLINMQAIGSAEHLNEAIDRMSDAYRSEFSEAASEFDTFSDKYLLDMRVNPSMTKKVLKKAGIPESSLAELRQFVERTGRSLEGMLQDIAQMKELESDSLERLVNRDVTLTSRDADRLEAIQSRVAEGRERIVTQTVQDVNSPTRANRPTILMSQEGSLPLVRAATELNGYSSNLAQQSLRYLSKGSDRDDEAGRLLARALMRFMAYIFWA
jgi:hypothetical protein